MAKTRDNPQVEGVRARAAARDASVEDFYARQEGLQPTPTQEENDLAKVGALDIDAEKVDDGSDYEEEHVRRIMEARIPGNNPYETREFQPGGDTGEGEGRRRGRRAKPAE